MKKLIIVLFIFAFCFSCSLESGNQTSSGICNDPENSQGAAAPALSDPTNPSVIYAETHWNWTSYSPSNHGTVAEGTMQPGFMCAEFVARSLSTRGIFPGINENTANYSYNGYNLKNVSGLYNYLINNGYGKNIGNNPAQAVPGDIVIYTSSSGVKEHTTILITTGDAAGTLVDSHNAAYYHAKYNAFGETVNGKFVYYAASIVHLLGSNPPPQTGNTTHIIFDVTGDFTNDTTGATYHTIPLSRVLDSRTGLGARIFQAQTKQSFQVWGVGGVPYNAIAVTGNVTVVSQTAAGYVTVAPGSVLTSGVTPPTSTINFPVSDTRANGVTIGLSASGTIDAMYWAAAGATTNVIFDVSGYFTNDTTGATYHAASLTRVLDSRSGLGAGIFQNKIKQSFPVWGLGGVPYNATGVTGNVTVVGQTSLGYVTISPALSSGVAPSTSTINFPVSDIRANTVTVGLSASGTLDAMYVAVAGATTNILFDITGYFTNDTSGATYHALAPCRIMDSRSGLDAGIFQAKTKQSFQVWGLGGVAYNTVGITGNVTVVGQTAAGYVTVGPYLSSGITPPTSTINFPVSDIRANGITVGLSASGTLDAMYLD